MAEASSVVPTAPSVGYLELAVGPMYAEKTTYLIRLANVKRRAVKVLYINHASDTRSDRAFSTHNDLFIPDIANLTNVDMIKVGRLAELADAYLSKYKCILIDEAQFFPDLPEEVIRFVEQLGKTVHVVGLSGDYKRKNFGRVHELLPLANNIEVLTTLCEVCAEKGEEAIAIHTQRKVDESGKQLEVGASNYRPVCRQCYVDVEAAKKVHSTVVAAVEPPATGRKKGKGRR